jgi:hypothetical protein
MQQRGPASDKSSPSAGRDALMALVRVLARQAAREFAAAEQALSDNKQPKPGDRK